MKFTKNINKEIKQRVKKFNGKVISEHVELFESQIDWDNKKNQTRDGDFDKGHLAALRADIQSRGLKNKPLVEFDNATGLYRIVSGFHRSTVQREILSSKENTQKLVFGQVEFSGDVDREFFMQDENHHPPQKAHTKKDAIRFVKNMREYGFFDSASGNTSVIKSMVDGLLQSHYCRLNGKSREEVFHESFKDKKLTRVLTVLKNDVKSWISNEFKNEKSFSWNSGKYLCWGDTNSARKAIAVALEKRVHLINNGKINSIGDRGKIKVVTYFDSSSTEDLERQREQFLKTEELLNRHAYEPGNVILISEVYFVPQVDGKRGIKETKMIKYAWNYEHRKFTKI